jgi:hypothetical protein
VQIHQVLTWALHAKLLGARGHAYHTDTSFALLIAERLGAKAGGDFQTARPRRFIAGIHMATRERRLAEFDGAGEPPPGTPVQVLCEDQSGTYQLPFACYFHDGQWRNHESGGALEATVIGWRLPRFATSHR